MSASKSNTDSKSTSSTQNTDNRSVDNSVTNIDSRDFSDNSTTTIQTTDNSVHQSTTNNTTNNTTTNIDSRDFSDRSTTTIQTTDARSYVDNSVHNTLDAEVAAEAFKAVSDANKNSGDAMVAAMDSNLRATDLAITTNAAVAAKSIDAQNEATAAAIKAQAELADTSMTKVSQAYNAVAQFETDTLGKVLEYTKAQADQTQDFTSKFVGDFYKSQQSADQQTSGDIIKYGSMVAGLGLLVLLLKKKAA